MYMVSKDVYWFYFSITIKKINFANKFGKVTHISYLQTDIPKPYRITFFLKF